MQNVKIYLLIQVQSIYTKKNIFLEP